MNELINWNITRYDDSDTVASFPVQVVTTINKDDYQTQSLADAFGFTLSSKQIETSPSRTNETLGEYDLSGNPMKMTDANGNIVEFVYDALGRRTSATSDPGAGKLNLTTTREYFGNTGLVEKAIDANGNEINYLASDYDVLGRLLKVRDRIDDVVSGDNYTTRVFDDDGNLDMITDAEGKITDYDYDLAGRKTITTYPDTKQEIIGYDELGRLESVRFLGIGETIGDPSDGLNRELIYAYSGVLTEIMFVDNRQTISDRHLFGYDEFLRRISAENEIDGVNQVFTYTDHGKLKTEQLDYDTTASNNPLFTTTFDYDDQGRLESTTYPESTNKVSYSYTDRRQLYTVTWDDGTANQIESRSYDPSGRLTNIDRDNFDEVRSFDAANRLLGISNQDASVSGSAGQIGDLAYTLDDNGNKQSESWSNGPTGMSAWDFTTVSTGSGDYLNGYDEENRLRRFIRNGTGTPTEAVSDAYMDRAAPGSNGTIGNIASLTGSANSSFNGSRTYSDIYELTSIGSTPLTQSYNLDGQVETMHSGDDLEWDAAGRLKEVDDGTDVYSYGYDCNGRRVWKKKQGESTFTVYAYGGPNCISDITITTGSPDTAVVNKEFVYGTTIDELLLVDKGSTQLGITRNQQWSVVGAYNYVSGAIVGRFNYDILGKRFVLNANGTLATNQDDDFGIPYGYTSRRHDAESGLMFYRARFYDPTTGEFISKDPLEYVDGMSLYRGYFVPNGMDPLGKCTGLFCQIVKLAPSVRGPCGGARARMRWEILNVSWGEHRKDLTGFNGWVIQKVQFDYNYTDCDGKDIAPDDVCYYEAWQVRNGDVYAGGSNKPRSPNEADQFNIGDRGEGTKGSITVSGSVTFISNYDLTYGPWGEAGEGDHPPQVRSLPWLRCGDGPPAGWGELRKWDRKLVSEWRCCPCGDRSETDVSKSSGWVSRCMRAGTLTNPLLNSR